MGQKYKCVFKSSLALMSLQPAPGQLGIWAISRNQASLLGFDDNTSSGDCSIMVGRPLCCADRALSSGRLCSMVYEHMQKENKNAETKALDLGVTMKACLPECVG